MANFVVPGVSFLADQLLTPLTYPVWSELVTAGNPNPDWTLVSSLNAASSIALAELGIYFAGNFIDFFNGLVAVRDFYMIPLAAIPVFYGLSKIGYDEMSKMFGDATGSIMVAVSAFVAKMLIGYFL